MSTGGGDLRDFSMMDLFRAEVEAQSAVLTEGLLAVERDASATPDIESLMRAAHSIKGAARIIQLDEAVQIAHIMEDCFVAAGEKRLELGPDDIDVLLRAVDLLNQIGHLEAATSANWWRTNKERFDATLAELAGVRDQKSRTSAPKKTKKNEPRVEIRKEPDVAAMSMLDLFRTETENQVGSLTERLLSLESAPSESSLEELMRAAHSIKGAARIVNVDPAVRLAHAMEDCFVAAQRGSIRIEDDAVDVLLAASDLLMRIANADDPASDPLVKDIDGVIANISRMTAGESPQMPSPDAGARHDGGNGRAAQQTVRQQAPREAFEPRKTETQVGREVRITSENLNRLMALAGETLVEARWLDPFAESLLRLKKRQVELSDLLDLLSRDRDDFDGHEYVEVDVGDAQQKVSECMQMLSSSLGELETYSRRSANLSSRLYREVIATRMRPFADGVKGFPRLVRDIAKTLHKKVRLEVLGTTTEVDRDILEKLEAPLNHLLRNAIDHGIESPEERLTAGKPEEGVIVLEAQHRAGVLMITVTDDGRGANIDSLKNKIVAKNLASADMVTTMSDAELLDFLFLPGFSTTSTVTEISGRGVGLDVVQSMVQHVGGTVRAMSREHVGMTFTLQLPLTRSVVRTLIVEVGDQPLAIPLARIDRALLIDTESIEVIENRQYFTFDQSNIGLVSAHQILDFPEPTTSPETLRVVVLSDQLNRYGLVVDRFVGEQDLVVRPIEPRLGKVPEVDAVAMMQDGTPVLIVDVDDMVRSIDNLLSGGRLRKVSKLHGVHDVRARKRILVVDDSITVREVERKLLENAGYQVEVAVDGMDGWNAVRTGHYDLVISDVDMPRMTGIELVSSIKGDPKLQGIPVVIVSYKDREEDRLRGLDAGANYYLTKSSFHDETMLNAVVDLIGRPE